MPYPLSPEARALQAAVRRYVDDELIPWEVHAEMNHGEVPPEILARQKKAARDLGLNSIVSSSDLLPRQNELMKMGVRPPHHSLQGPMELAKCYIPRN